MIKKILLWLLACLVIIFLAVWIWTGGLGRAWTTAKTFTNVVDLFFFHSTTTKASLKLPWQPDYPSGLPEELFNSPENDSGNQQDQISSLDNEFDTLNSQFTELKTFGDPSPFRGQVRILSEANAKEVNPQEEYIEIGTASQNTAPIDLRGWSLQSMYTGARAYIPQGASQFAMGTVNVLGSVQLSPGESAIVVSGISPVGVSFRENICTGYLAQLQPFTPQLRNSCPSPAKEIPMTADNLRNYGESCFNLIQTIPSCTAPLNDYSTAVSANCRSVLLTVLSYNGCVNKNRASKDFAANSWRIYLNFRAELWRNSHDIIRLLDASGRTVDVLTY